MSEPLNDAVAHLRALSLHLNDVTDRATAAVRRVEIFLTQECRLGLTVHVPVTASGPDTPTLQLGFARNGDRYRIVVRALAYREEDGRIARHETTNAPLIDQQEQVAWAECARATKLETFQHLPALVSAIQAQVAEVATRADAAVAAATAITGVLGEAPAEAEGADERTGRHHRHHGHGHHGHHRDERGGCGDERGRDERGRCGEGRGDERGRCGEGRGDDRGHGWRKHGRHADGGHPREGRDDRQGTGERSPDDRARDVRGGEQA